MAIVCGTGWPEFGTCYNCSNRGEADKMYPEDATQPAVGGEKVIKFLCDRHSPSKTYAWVEMNIDSDMFTELKEARANQKLVELYNGVKREHLHARQVFINCKSCKATDNNKYVRLRDTFIDAMIAEDDARLVLSAATSADHNKRRRLE